MLHIVANEVLEAWITLCHNRASAARALHWKLPELYDPRELADTADTWDALAQYLREELAWRRLQR